jgi:N-acetylmuramoyl-L-alanine amidase
VRELDPDAPPPRLWHHGSVRRSARAARVALGALALAAACARTPPAPSPLDIAALREALARCPIALDDAALRDLATHEACPLPGAVARLVRNDYADDAPGPADGSGLAEAARAVTRDAFERALAGVVDPAGALASWIAVDRARDALLPDPVLAPGLAIPFAPAARGAAVGGEPAAPGRLPPPTRPEEPYRPARRAELIALATAARPLAGLRVAVDPGHAGGAFARLEERRITWRPAPGAPEIVLQEGDLTLRTALELRAKLAALGAEVHLTRDAPGFGYAGDLASFRPFAEALLARIALDPAYARLERALAPEERLRLHAALALYAVRKQNRFASLRARAESASRAGADLLLSIHYNAAPRALGSRGPQELVAMVAGDFEADRLYNASHRARALRAALRPDALLASAHLGARCVAEMSALLALPAARENRYPDHLPLLFSDGRSRGVDAWDGALLRYADIPAVLVEGPYMTDGDEMPRLDAALRAPPGTAGTRTERYAEALARCVEQFARRWREAERNPFGPAPP